ncbi:hypothetical protein ThimaDRAFT_4350 [Thiocapsa marina 5811]|uniref:Transposase IS200-like domain-containing protein n=1 Tax=Thiocapsa marina 5811 TaxID=768671 RepID=F9UHE7_9GAMM|nr:hypothetical protein ThimaDRAFT_4350 [Thiocapsa marina 5811]
MFADVFERFRWRGRAYCEMTNHYHVVVETPEGNLSKGMRQLDGVFTQRVNRLGVHDSTVSRAVRRFEHSDAGKTI